MNEFDETVTCLALCWKVPVRNPAGKPSIVAEVHIKVMPRLFLLRPCVCIIQLRVVPWVMILEIESVHK